MRKLVILRGAMGCGKTTFIKNNNLEEYTLSTDNIRLMFASPQMNISYGVEIPQHNNKEVWELLYHILEERMKKGEFTIIDAVHANTTESFSIYKNLAEKYRYRLYVLDFTDIKKEEVYLRNSTREQYKIVPEHAIDRAYKAFKKEKVPSSFKVVKPENFNFIINTDPKNLDNYNKIHVIGDIHGCYTALKKYFDINPINDNEYYIFVGDYFDRGIENIKTFKFINELMQRENMLFLIGNHEDKLYKYACDDEFRMDYDIKKTIEEFEENHLEKKEIRGFIKKLSQVAYIEYGEKVYLISHGGIPYIPDKPLDFYSTNSFIYGVGLFEIDVDKIYNDFMEQQDKKIYQIHGHRNYYKIKCDNYKYSFNLEGGVEEGVNLRILTLNKNGISDIIEIKNPIFNLNLIEETKVFNLVDELRKNKYVYEKSIDSDVSSFNFTKEAFYNNIWNNITTKARGIFIDTKKYKIIARSYDKFFKINEKKETNIETILDKLTYPVAFYLKYNGFLGILSLRNDELFFASKSTDTGNYVEYFKTIFFNNYNEEQISSLKSIMKEKNISIVFEVIDPINDPHIIDAKETNLIILDMIYNTTNYAKINYNVLSEFALKNNLTLKKLAYTANNLDEFYNIYKEVSASDYNYCGEEIEGFVIEDQSGFMAKIKTVYYDTWKYLRTKLEYSIKTGNFKNNYKSVLEENFSKFIENKYNKNPDNYQLNILIERKEFEKNK